MWLTQLTVGATRDMRHQNTTVTVTNTQKIKRKDNSDIEKKLQFLYVVPAQHEHQTAADAHLQYYCV